VDALDPWKLVRLLELLCAVEIEEPNPKTYALDGHFHGCVVPVRDSQSCELLNVPDCPFHDLPGGAEGKVIGRPLFGGNRLCLGRFVRKPLHELGILVVGSISNHHIVVRQIGALGLTMCLRADGHRGQLA
jgi:hypothetical protein